jgi:hypothetical protein
MKVSMRALLGSLLAPAVLLAFACGGSAATTTTGGDGGGVDASTDGSTPDGSVADGATDGSTGGDLFPADTTKIVVTEKGGFGIGAPDGSTCSPIDRTFTLLYPSGELSWKLCEASDAGTYSFTEGKKTFSQAELAPLTTALHGLRRATQTACGADKPSEEIVFTTPAGETTYLDDFYFCDPKDTKAYVTGLDEVLAELGKLAK